jgi:hypothetical protein
MSRTVGVSLAISVASLLVSIAGCGDGHGNQAAAPPPPPSCQQPPAAALPGAAGSLDETSAGAYCLPAGQTIDVFLHSPASATGRWTPIVSSDVAVLRPQRTGVLTAPVGVTPGIFGGLRPGTATLSSTGPDKRTWSVTIVVQPATATATAGN